MKNILEIDQIPILLNKLYQPIVNKSTGKPAIIKSKEAKEYTKYIWAKYKPKCKVITGKVKFYMDIDIGKRKDYDIDALLKLLFDSLEGICYENDSQIVDLRVRKFTDTDIEKLTILIESI